VLQADQPLAAVPASAVSVEPAAPLELTAGCRSSPPRRSS